MDFLSKLIKRPRSSVILTAEQEMENKSIESLLLEINESLNQKVSAGGSLKQSTQPLKNIPAQLHETPIDESKNSNNQEQIRNDDNGIDLDSANSKSIKLIDLENGYEDPVIKIPVALDSLENEQSNLVGKKYSLLDSTFDNNQDSIQHKGIRDKQNSTLSIATSSCIDESKNVSSDDEIFDECQSFLSMSTNAIQSIEKQCSELHDSLWNNLVSSVTSTNVDEVENKVASESSNIDGYPDKFGIADSTTSNASIAEMTLKNKDHFTESKEEIANSEEVQTQNGFIKENSSTDVFSNVLPNNSYTVSLSSKEESNSNTEHFPTKLFDNTYPSFPTSPKSPEIKKNNTETNIESINRSISLSQENLTHATLNKTNDNITSSYYVENSQQDISIQFEKSAKSLDSSSVNSSNVEFDHVSEFTTSSCSNKIKETESVSDLNQINEDNEFEEKIEPQDNPIENRKIKIEHPTIPENLEHFENISVTNVSENNLNHTFESNLDNIGNQTNGESCYQVNNLTMNKNSPKASNLISEIVIKSEANNSYEDMDIDISCVSETETVQTNMNMTLEDVNNDQKFNPSFNTVQVDTPMINMDEYSDTQEPTDKDFQCDGLILNSCDFDYLLTKGNNNVEVDRSSLLLRFDPLLGIPVPVNIAQTQSPNNPSVSSLTSVIGKQQSRLSPAVEEDEFIDNNCNRSLKSLPKIIKSRDNSLIITTNSTKKHAAMSVNLINDMKTEHDIKSIDNFESMADDKPDYKMDGLQKKIKNEVIKSEEDEKRNKDSEQREEALLKRITEKEKTMAKMNGVIEAYEKAIAELIAEKEQIIQKYEAELMEVKADRDSNYRHLTSLETTFSDLHVKYEKSKEMTTLLKNNEEALKQEKYQNLQNLRLQEQRYDKMKNHAMQQLEIANKKLESLTRNHSHETTKLKALLKKEEVSRASMQEQLNHKSRENEELVKICDELINGQGS